MALWMRPMSDRNTTAPTPREDPDAQSQEAEGEQIHASFFAVAGGDLGRNGCVGGR
jgi:hypothetical protein